MQWLLWWLGACRIRSFQVISKSRNFQRGYVKVTEEELQLNLALSVRMFILHLQSSTFFKTLLCFWESQQKSSKACILRCWIQAAILKWLHSTMFLVSIVVLNLTQSVWIFYIKTSALHAIPLGMWNEKWKSCKQIHVLLYLMLNTST